MGIFNNPGPFDADVDKVTPEEDKGSEDWASILDICDKVSASSANAKDCLRSIIRRLNHPSPHVVLKAISLLDACVKNCPKKFHLEIASREFEGEYRRLLKRFQTSHPRLAEDFKNKLRKWAENEFKSDSELSLIPALYNKLKSEGVEFSTNPDSVPKNSSALPKDPDAVTSQQEVDDIAKAIELSLKETNSSSGQGSLYPSTNTMNSNTPSKSHNTLSQPTKPKLIVKALYDFLDVEDNELVFYAGELIEVLDDSDKNWWKGATRRGEGLFPSNFVTTDLSSDSDINNEPQTSEKDRSIKTNRVRFNDNVGVHQSNHLKQEDIIINEQKIDRLLHLLHEANPTDETADTDEMLILEDEANAMGPLIDTELEKVDRKHAQLTQLSSNLVDALNLYHSLMREQPYMGNPMVDSSYGPMSMPVHNVPYPQMMYNSGMNGAYSMLPGNMMNDQYGPNSLPGPIQQTGNVHDMNHQPASHHFVPIASVPVQPESFHPQPGMSNPPIAPQTYNMNLDPNMGPMRYNMQPNPLIPPQQMPQHLYQPIQHQMPLQEISSPGATLPSSNSM